MLGSIQSINYGRKRLISSRKGDAGVAAATLVLLIALIVVFYILAVDPEVRDQILNSGSSPGTGTGSTGGSGTGASGAILLNVEPGKIEATRNSETVREIGSIRIESKQLAIQPVKDRAIFVRNS